MSIERVRLADSAEWDEIWKNCDYSTFFHSREWAEICSEYSNGSLRPKPMLVVFSDKKKALLPFSCARKLKGLVTNIVSSPMGTYGGWISTDDLSVPHAVLLCEYLTVKLKNLQLRLNPYDEIALRSGIKFNKYDETHALSLVCGFDEIFAGWTKGHSSAARKARKEGVRIRIGSTLDDWQAYCQVYLDTLRRWGDRASSSYSEHLFLQMFQKRSSNIKLWLAFYEDKVVAGAVCFYAGRHAVYWHGAALEETFKLRPVNLLMYEVIKDACENGYEWFDFNPSGGHPGVVAFKKSFGARPLPCPVIITQSGWSKLIRRIAARQRDR